MIRTPAWWNGQPERRRDLIVWLGPLVAIALIVAVDWLWRQHQGVANPHEGRTLILRVGYVCALAAAIMAIFTRRYPLQQLGLLVLLFGLGGLFVRVMGQQGPQPVGERTRDLIQAMLDVGSVVVMVAVLIFAVQNTRAVWKRVLVVLLTVAFGILYYRA